MGGPRKGLKVAAGEQSPVLNLPDLTQHPYPTLVALWKAQGQALCPVCGYQCNETGCLWDPSHEEQ